MQLSEGGLCYKQVKKRTPFNSITNCFNIQLNGLHFLTISTWLIEISAPFDSNKSRVEETI